MLQYSDTRFPAVLIPGMLCGQYARLLAENRELGANQAAEDTKGFTLLSGFVDLSAFGSSICCHSLGRDFELGQEKE